MAAARKPRTWLSPREAAAVAVAAGLALTPYLVRRMCEDGAFVFAHKTPGGQWRIPPSAMQTYIDRVQRDRRDARSAVVRRRN